VSRSEADPGVNSRTLKSHPNPKLQRPIVEPELGVGSWQFAVGSWQLTPIED